MKQTVLKYGLMAGGIVSVWLSVSMLVIGCDASSGGMVLGYAGMLVAFSFIFVAIKNYRDQVHGGTVSFWKAFQIGLLVSLIGSAFYVATWAILYHNFMPNFMDKYAAVEIQKLKASGISAAELKAEVDKMDMYKDMYKTPFWFVVMTLAEIFPVGLLVSIITALILKRNTPQIKEA